MIRSFSCVAIWLVLALGVAHGVPARPRYEPAPLTPEFSLIDTTWAGFLYVEGEQITFNADGTLTYNMVNGGSKSPGSWRLTGNQLYFEVNKWSEFNTVVNGNTIAGPGINKDRTKTSALLKRVANPNPAVMLPRR